MLLSFVYALYYKVNCYEDTPILSNIHFLATECQAESLKFAW